MNNSFLRQIAARVWAHRWHIAIAAVLFLALALRLHAYTYPLESADVNRDYLVAHHIRGYGEHVLAGPWNDVLGDLKNSPAYFYLQALPLFVYDSVATLGIFNIILQIAAILFLYLTGRELFNERVGIVAALLYAVGSEAMLQAAYPLMPHVMFPFMQASLYLFALFYTGRRELYLWSSLALLALAIALHNSALALAPLFVVCALYLLRRRGADGRSYVFAALAFLGPLVLLYTPVALYVFEQRIDPLPLLSQGNSYWQGVWVSSPQAFAARLGESLLELGALLPPLNVPRAQHVAAGVAVLIVMFAVYRRDRLIAVLVTLAVLPLFLSSFLDVPFRFSYFTPAFGVWVLLAAAAFECMTRAMPLIRYIAFSAFAVYVGAALSAQLSIVKPAYVEGEAAAERAAEAIVAEVERLGSDGARDFFQVYQEGRGSAAPLLIPLEERFGRLVRLDDRAGNSTAPLTRDDIVFWVCNWGYHPELRDACTADFSSTLPHHRIQKKLHDEWPFVIYVAAREY